MGQTYEINKIINNNNNNKEVRKWEAINEIKNKISLCDDELN